MDGEQDIGEQSADYMAKRLKTGMMETINLFWIICAVVGMVLGLAFGLLLSHGQKGKLKTLLEAGRAEALRLDEENTQLRSDLKDTSEERQRLQTRCEVQQARLEQLVAQHARELETQTQAAQQLLEAKDKECRTMVEAQEARHNQDVANLKSTFDQTVANLKSDMKAATEEMLKSRQQEFSDASQKNIKDIVDPLNETIDKMKEAMAGYSKEQSAFGGAMKASIETIIRQTETARQSAEELTTALKHDSKVQGDYGEAILDEILSSQGFTEGVHYELQYTLRDDSGRPIKSDDGREMRPDVLFHLDKVRDVIIDSKVNLTDFINFANASLPEERQKHLQKHVASIRAQIKLLSQKNYTKYHGKTNGRMDYVILFVPISAAWWEALRCEPSLWREAMDSKVYIADEQTLFAALSIIKLTWTQIAQVENQQKVFALADEMINRVGQFMKSYEDLGNALNAAKKAYGAAENKLTPGGQSILTTASQLLAIGAKDSKKNPVTPFLDIDDVEALPAAGADKTIADSDGDGRADAQGGEAAIIE